MRINNNIMALTAYRMYALNSARVAKSIERLSSGYRINRAADDPAGLAISEKMRAQIRGLNMASRNCQDAVSLLQTAEGALQETHNILRRLKELATQAASDTYDNEIDRVALNAEYQQLLKEINDTANKADFNGRKLLNGSVRQDLQWKAGSELSTVDDTVIQNLEIIADSDWKNGDYKISFDDTSDEFILTSGGQELGRAKMSSYEDGHYSMMLGGAVLLFDIAEGSNLTGAGDFDSAFDVDKELTITNHGLIIQTGANKGDEMRISIAAMNTTVLGLDGSDLLNRENASNALGSLEKAINVVSRQRAYIGAMQNRLEYKINNLDTMSENLQAAESRIRDVDIAKEMMEFMRYQILTQTAIAMLAQANSIPQIVLQLLQ